MQNKTNGNVQFNTATTDGCSVTLHVSDATGEVNQSAVGITVTAPLEITLSANWTTISAGQSVLFTNTTTGGTGSNAYSYLVTALLGNCAGVQNSNNKLMFPNAGTCNVTLHVSDLSGETNSSSVTITVTPPLVTTLVNESRLYISADQSVKFTNSTTGGTGSIVNHYFVNGGLVTPLENESIVFTTAGSYSVTLGSTDATGEVSNSSTITVTVTPPLETTVTANRTLISTGQQIKFTNTTTGGTGQNVYYYTNTCGSTVQNKQNGNVWQFNTTTTDGCSVILHVSRIRRGQPVRSQYNRYTASGYIHTHCEQDTHQHGPADKVHKFDNGRHWKQRILLLHNMRKHRTEQNKRQRVAVEHRNK